MTDIKNYPIAEMSSLPEGSFIVIVEGVPTLVTDEETNEPVSIAAFIATFNDHLERAAS